MMTARIPHCTNCGLSGHVFRNCLSPVTSYGVIAVRYQDDLHSSSLFSKTSHVDNGNQSIQFLLIKRKDSLAFVEFIRGKYSHQDEVYIVKLLEGMTQHEQELIRTKTFPELWFEVWGESSTIRSHKTDYESSDRRHSQIVDRLPAMIDAHPSKWVEP
jgi:hypothetical protein